MPSHIRDKIELFLRTFQQDVVKQLEALDPDAPKFQREVESVPNRMDTTTFLSQRTGKEPATSDIPFAPIERAFLALSFVKLQMPPSMAANGGPALTKSNITFPPPGAPFYGAHLSVVIHPRSPHAPTLHCNWRYFEVLDSDDNVTDWWYGGTINLTPSYLYEEDCELFHKTLKDTASTYGKDTYGPMKEWCDKYFYNPFRKEARGTGGIFFDGLSDKPHEKFDIQGGSTERPKTAETCLDFFRSTGKVVHSAYIPILQRRAHLPWTEEERHWQLVRRGRFVEFVLLVDEGIRRNLQAGGDTLESMLLVLPETAQWTYMASDMPQTERESKLISVLQEPRKWA
ncbi:coproporphyrinogen III oxidase [Ceratobasidium sp. AG-Ba]|nr:coproporphyrinogen III oxidase [Ceratobasidium sp. AG-Ba]